MDTHQQTTQGAPDLEAGTQAEDIAHMLQGRWAAGHPHTIGCGPGWHDLLRRLHHELSQLCPQYRLTRIRVREGQLRYEIHPLGLPTHDPARGRQLLAVRNLISRYESESGRVCEETGQAGRLHRRDGQLRTLADLWQQEGWEPVQR